MRKKKELSCLFESKDVEVSKQLSLPKESFMKAQCNKELKQIISSSDIQLKDKVEAQIGPYIDCILPSRFHSLKNNYVFALCLLSKRITKHRVCYNFTRKLEDQCFT